MVNLIYFDTLLELVEASELSREEKEKLAEALEELRKNTIVTKRCEHCGAEFVPTRLNEKYCNGVSPIYPDKTCKEAEKYIKQLRRENGNEVMQAEKRAYNKLLNRSKTQNGGKRAKAGEKLNQFMAQKQAWKDAIASSQSTKEQYITWLQEI